MPENPLGLEAGTLIAERYRIERELGKGGMGAVYEALHTVTLRRGALKVLHHELGQVPEVVARFLREASAAGRIGSPHIVETLDAGRCATGEPYIFMELLRGHSLEQELSGRGPLPFDRALEYIRQACRGLGAAHEAGIVHRDIKPDNLFLLEGTKPFIKILDFGISKFDPALTAARALTVEGSTLGTPFFMSPEQVQGRTDVDARTDIYSLGVTLYRLLTGKYPFVAETLPAIAIAIHRGEYTPVSELCRVPDGFDDVLARAMAKDPADRFESCAAFERALARFEGKLPAGSVAAHSTPADPRLSTSPPLAATNAPLSHTLGERVGQKKRPTVLIALVLGGAVLAGVLVALRSGDTTPEPASSAEPQPLRTRPAEPVVVPADATRVATDGAEPSSAPPPPSAEAAASAAPATSTPSTAKPTPARPAGATAKKPLPSASASDKPALKSGRLGSEFTRQFE